uniref:Uncharacterized protein n=1 Tax=Salix viminalis TaxID=40686 RepID=A0A6N2KWD4_SALVM
MDAGRTPLRLLSDKSSNPRDPSVPTSGGISPEKSELSIPISFGMKPEMLLEDKSRMVRNGPVEVVVAKVKPDQARKGRESETIKRTSQIRTGQTYVDDTAGLVATDSEPVARVVSSPRRQERLALAVETDFPF